MLNDYNKLHSPFPTALKVGAWVLLDREGIRWQPASEVSQKLVQPYIGPVKAISFEILNDRLLTSTCLPR